MDAFTDMFLPGPWVSHGRLYSPIQPAPTLWPDCMALLGALTSRLLWWLRWFDLGTGLQSFNYP